MGRYRLGDIIRMTRKSLFITQEQLCDEICSVETLSRIENGNQNPSRDTYELLMERMGRIRERAYSMLSVSDFKVLEKMRLFEDYVKQYDFTQAEKVLEEIKEILGDSILDTQFLINAQSLIDFRLNRISREMFLDNFQKAIRLTIPKYGIISLSRWPLTSNEALLLNNIASAYAEFEDYEKAIEISKEVYEAMKQSYMEEKHRVLYQIVITANLSKYYGLTKNHHKAIEMIGEGIELCRKFKLGNILPNLLYNMAWNIEQLIEMGEISPDHIKECINYLKQAYFIALATQQPFAVKFIHKHIREKYASDEEKIVI